MTGAEQRIVRFASDARVHHQLYPATSLEARLRGRITRTNRRGGICFLTLLDVSESIQLVAERSSLSEASWEAVRCLARGSSVRVSGAVRETSNGTISVFLSDAPKLLRSPTADSLLSDHFDEVGAQLLLARLSGFAREFFLDNEFNEIEARLLSTAWPEGGLNPLRVHYPGFGRGSFYLAISPVPQLFRAQVATHQDRVFTVTRCFTSSYLDHIAGVESVILSAQMLDFGLSGAAQLAGRAVSGVLRNFRPEMAADTMAGTNTVLRPGVWPPAGDRIDVQEAEIQIYTEINDLQADINGLFRLVFPPDYLLAEGYCYSVDDALRFTVLNINLERMVPLLRSGSLRRVLNRSIGAP